jgi:hypothetical protein
MKGQTMTILKTHALALTAVMVAVTAFSAPLSAQTRAQRSFATAPAATLQNQPESSAGSTVPSYVLSTPEKHWVEDGNGRWSTADGN